MSKQNVKPTGGHVLFFLFLVLIFGATGCQNYDASVFQNKLISEDQASNLSSNFVNKFAACDSFVQTYAWFSAEELSNYLTYAQRQADSLHVVPSGVRVYFGVYPKGAPEGREGKLTVFFAPTQAVPVDGRTVHKLIDLQNDQQKYMLNFGNMGYPPKVYGAPE